MGESSSRVGSWPGPETGVAGSGACSMPTRRRVPELTAKDGVPHARRLEHVTGWLDRMEALRQAA